MSSNRLHYDKCAEKLQEAQSKNILTHTMDVNMFQNTKANGSSAVQPGSYRVATKSRNFKNGSAGALVDVESKLRSLDKKAMKCNQ